LFNTSVGYFKLVVHICIFCCELLSLCHWYFDWYLRFNK